MLNNSSSTKWLEREEIELGQYIKLKWPKNSDQEIADYKIIKYKVYGREEGNLKELPPTISLGDTDCNDNACCTKEGFCYFTDFFKVKPGETYKYQVKSIDENGCESKTEAEITTPAPFPLPVFEPDTVPPNPPIKDNITISYGNRNLGYGININNISSPGDVDGKTLTPQQETSGLSGYRVYGRKKGEIEWQRSDISQYDIFLQKTPNTFGKTSSCGLPPFDPENENDPLRELLADENNKKITSFEWAVTSVDKAGNESEKVIIKTNDQAPGIPTFVGEPVITLDTKGYPSSIKIKFNKVTTGSTYTVFDTKTNQEITKNLGMSYYLIYRREKPKDNPGWNPSPSGYKDGWYYLNHIFDSNPGQYTYEDKYDLKPETIYQYKVIAIDNGLNWSREFVIFFKTKDFFVKNLQTPLCNSCDKKPNYNFTWEYKDIRQKERANSYIIEFDTDPNFSSPEILIDKTLSNETYKSDENINSSVFLESVGDVVDKLEYNKKYYWRVRMIDKKADQSSDWLAGPSFQTPVHRYPNVNFNIPKRIKINQETEFKNKSLCYKQEENIIGDINNCRSFEWKIMDENDNIITTSTDTDLTYIFKKTGKRKIKLKVTNQTGFECSEEESFTVESQSISPQWKEIVPIF